MRLIANSDTYQLASDYSGTWNPAWDQYFARKFVRRLWSEEIHDSIIPPSILCPSYTVANFTNDSTVYGVNFPGLRKNLLCHAGPRRRERARRRRRRQPVPRYLSAWQSGRPAPQEEGSILQALALMNDNFVETRIHATGTGATATFLQKLITLPDAQLVTTLFLDVLSRQPSGPNSLRE